MNEIPRLSTVPPRIATPLPPLPRETERAASRRPRVAALLCMSAAALLSACATQGIDANLDAARAEVHARAGLDLVWLDSEDARRRAAAEVADTLSRPLGMDDAVRVALANDPALQALLFDRAAESAAATQSARLPNPVFEWERLASHAGGATQFDITRMLTLPLLDLILLPARAGAADAAQARLRLRLADDVLHAANEARVAWIAAVAARQSLAYARQVQDAADAGAELARRLEAAGSFSALDRAREEAFAADALADAASARRLERTTREALVRALGLDDAGAQALHLPEQLPDLPAAPREEPPEAALDARLDIRLARAQVDEAARAQGITRATSLVGSAGLGIEHQDQSGQPKQKGVDLTVPLPLFDPGDAARAEGEARLRAAQWRAQALAVAAGSQWRQSRDDYRDAWALARHAQERVVPLRQAIVAETTLRANGMLASIFDLLADAREASRAVQRATAAQRDFWFADAALRSAELGVATGPAGRLAAVDAEAR
jgi:outer membrane protein TolC